MNYKILLTALIIVSLMSCKDVAHEDEKDGLKWKEVSLIGADGNTYRLSCPVRAGGFRSAHNNGCYLKEVK